MHPAPPFHVTDEAPLLAHLQRHPFCLIAAAPQGGAPLIAHAPVIAARREGRLWLEFHLSARNALAGALPGGFAAAAVSLGPEAYISPDWYGAADQVPTWNYVSVEASGAVEAMGGDDTVALLDALSARMEADLAPKPPWTRAKMSPGRFEAMTRGIVGARLAVERLEGTFKLSQNKVGADIDGVIAALGEHPLGRLMRSGIE
jgi:transcriptional regulator